MLRGGQLTAGQAKPLLALGKRAEQLALARRAVAEGLSARQLEALAAAAREGAAPSPREAPPRDVHSAAAAEQLTRCLQTRVEIRRRRDGGGTVQIHFSSEEELMRLYDRLNAEGSP